MRPIRTFVVKPLLPAPIERLRDLAYNLRWTWDHDAIALFRRLDPDLWETSGHNPVLMLGTIDQSHLQAAAADDAFLAHLERVARDFDTYMAGKPSWIKRTRGKTESPLVAYFSFEFGLTECIPIFAGGLGVLAGDLLKSASDLGQPMVGVSLLYQQGYFRQHINAAGLQEESWEDVDFHNLPIQLERLQDGTPVTVTLPYPGRPVTAQVWHAQVGRVVLYLLDTNVPNNWPEDRQITRQLYGGDLEMRIKQEVMLGVGGFRALEALGLRPVIYHMNEGHSAFLALERVRQMQERCGCSFTEAQEAASASLVFTTHTPVAAGHDYFPPHLMDRYFGDYYRNLGVSRRDFLALGRKNPDDEAEAFCMTVLALKMAAHSNGVSGLHGDVTRRMWRDIWPRLPVDQVPIGHVTNGVHLGSWISAEIHQLYDRYLGPRWREEPADQSVWQRVERIPGAELWRTHELRRERMVEYVRSRLRAQMVRSGAPPADVELADEVLDPEALTIGFARRFVAYKRATLLLRDPARLAQLLNDPKRPVQLVFAGKAHPQDEPGQDLIRQIFQLTRQEAYRRRVVFLEDYEIALARYLVSGCDVWLNTPRRLREASGTSGMKAAANGVLNLSTLDGWWDEAWEGSDLRTHPIGWAVGGRDVYDDLEYQDQVEAEALFDLLEREIVPMFYDRGPDGLSRRWIDRMKASIGTLTQFFNTHRMVREYVERYYVAASTRFSSLTQSDMQRAKDLASWKVRIRECWPGLRVEAVETDASAELPAGSQVRVRARVRTDGLASDDLAVEFYLGRVDAAGDFVEPQATRMQPLDDVPGSTLDAPGEGYHVFEVAVPVCSKSGVQGFTVRILPHHPDLTTPFLPGLITWAEPDVITRFHELADTGKPSPQAGAMP